MSLLRLLPLFAAVAVAFFAAPAALAHDAPGFQADVRRQDGLIRVRLAADGRTWRIAEGLAALPLGAVPAGRFLSARRDAWTRASLAAMALSDALGRSIILSVESPVGSSPLAEDFPSLEFEAQDPGGELSLALSLFHREDSGEGVVRWCDEGGSRVVRLELPGKVLLTPIEEGRGGTAALSFVAAGIKHIWTGWDHLAFLLTLLLVGRRLLDTIKVATAFTVAHSLTLALAALSVVRIPPAPVEALIAVSIVAAATANLLSRDPRNRGVMAFAFGLVHGLGFSSGLAALLGRETGARLVAVASFNGGVELGQLAVVLLVAPPLLFWRRRAPRSYERAGLRGLSAAAGVAGLFWLAERTFLA